MTTAERNEPHPNAVEANEFLDIRHKAWELAKVTGNFIPFRVASQNVNRFLVVNPIPKES